MAAGFAALAACAPAKMTDGALPAPSKLTRQRASFTDLPDWRDDTHGAALLAFRHSCRSLRSQPASRSLGGGGIGGTVADWRPICAAAAGIGAVSVAGIDGAFSQSGGEHQGLNLERLEFGGDQAAFERGRSVEYQSFALLVVQREQFNVRTGAAATWIDAGRKSAHPKTPDERVENGRSRREFGNVSLQLRPQLHAKWLLD